MNIILLGAPGSGKGTQAERVAKKFHLYYFQTGKLSRELAKKDARVRKIVDAGELIPEQEMTMYVIDYLSKKSPKMKNILFEGFPRFIGQYEALVAYLKTKGDKVDAVISLDISEKGAIKRLASRRICSKCNKVYNLVTNPPPATRCQCGGKLIQRKDDRPESIKLRFQYYEENTQELIDYLEKKGKIIRIDGERPIDVIFKDIVSRLEKKVAK